MPVTEGAPAHGAVSHLLPQSYKRTIAAWLEEDTPSFDYGGFVVGEEMAEARLLGKSKVGAFCTSSSSPEFRSLKTQVSYVLGIFSGTRRYAQRDCISKTGVEARRGCEASSRLNDSMFPSFHLS